jgi:hypothetical protein
MGYKKLCIKSIILRFNDIHLFMDGGKIKLCIKSIILKFIEIN